MKTKEEFNLSQRVRILKVAEELWPDETNKILLVDDVKEFIEKIIYEDLNACRVCGDSHGDWFRIGTFIKKIKKRAGDKLK